MATKSKTTTAYVKTSDGSDWPERGEHERVAKKITSWIKANPGRNVDDMALDAGVPAEAFARPIAKLIRDGVIERGRAISPSRKSSLHLAERRRSGGAS